MTEHSLWAFSRALFDAIEKRQPERVSAFLEDDVDWAIYGPIDIFPFLGARRGKGAVLEVLRQIADNFQLRRFDCEMNVLNEEAASTLLRCSLTSNDDNKPISLRLANFTRFSKGKLASLRIVIDTFDLVEQALGRPIDLVEVS